MISVALEREALLPGETLRGRVEWRLDDQPEALEIRLTWFTEGRGDRDVGVARTLRIESLGSSGTREFSLEAPTGPYSCSGRLISVRWVVEATLEPSRETDRQDWLLGPFGREVLLGQAAS